MTLTTPPPSDDVVPPLAQVHLLDRGTGPLGFRSGRLSCGDALSAALGRLLSKSRLRVLPLYAATVVRCVVSPAATALSCSLGVEHPPEGWEPPQATHRGAYPQLRCVWPKRWLRLYCSGLLEPTFTISSSGRYIPRHTIQQMLAMMCNVK